MRKCLRRDRVAITPKQGLMQTRVRRTWIILGRGHLLGGVRATLIIPLIPLDIRVCHRFKHANSRLRSALLSSSSEERQLIEFDTHGKVLRDGMGKGFDGKY